MRHHQILLNTKDAILQDESIIANTVNTEDPLVATNGLGLDVKVERVTCVSRCVLMSCRHNSATIILSR